MSSPVPPSTARTAGLTALAMLAFAGNSLLCRLALKAGAIDAASFTSLRLLSGALTLALLCRWRDGAWPRDGNWTSAMALFVYAAGFSWAYLGLTAATGALLLFGAVQLTMVGTGLVRGEHLRPLQWVGLLAAAAGLVALLLPGLQAPPAHAAALMLLAGVAWGVYPLRGRGVQRPIEMTAGNFVRASVPALLLCGLLGAGALPWHASPRGPALALASGAITSGLGYAVWYTALRNLAATRAAIVQLSVPPLAALAAVALLDEPLTLRLLVASAVVLGGVAVVIVQREVG